MWLAAGVFKGRRVPARHPPVEKELEVARQTTRPLPVRLVIEIGFPAFTPRITIRSERELTVEIVAGENVGFADSVEYEAVAIRDRLVMLSWQEHIGSTCMCSISFPPRRIPR